MPELFKSGTATAETSATPSAEDAEIVEINWDEEIVAEHPDADINELLPLPEGGKAYVWKVRLLDRGETDNPSASRTSKKVPFLTVGLELELVDESSPFHGYKITDYVNSLVFGNRGTSAVHHVMNCIGETLPSVISLKDMRDKIVSAFESGPLVNAELEWKASIKTGPGKYDWTAVVKKMKDFPKNPEGDGYLQIYKYTDPKSKVISELRAQAYIKAYILQGQGG